MAGTHGRADRAIATPLFHEEQWEFPPSLTGTAVQLQCLHGLLCAFIALFFLTAVAPLTPEAVTEAVKEVDWGLLCRCLGVPESKCDEIEAHHPPEDHKRVLVDWWFSTDPAPSWRRLIHQLDYGYEGDKIPYSPEPVQGMLSTLMWVCMDIHCSEWYNFILVLGHNWLTTS